jgi:hypothetical protein
LKYVTIPETVINIEVPDESITEDRIELNLSIKLEDLPGCAVQVGSVNKKVA